MEPVPKKRTTRRAVVETAVDVPQSVPKKTRTPKKAAAKVATVKKVRAKASEKTQSVPIKRVVKRGIKSPFTAEVMAEVTETNVDKETVKMVTGPLSPRLREKLALYELWYQTEAPKYMEGTAKLFGYAFIISGFLLAYSLMSSTTFRDSSYLAALMCASDTCEEPGVPVETSTETQALPQVHFETAPTVASGVDTEVTVTVTDAASHQLFVLDHASGLRIPVEQAGFDGVHTYTYRIPTTSLEAGEYSLILRAQALDDSATSEFTGASFSVATETEVIDTTTVSATTTALDATSTSSEEVASSTEAVVQPEPAVLGISTSTDEVVPTLPEDDGEEVSTTATVPLEEDIQIAIIDGVLPKQYRVNVTTTYDYSRIALTLRALNSTVPLILGSATETASGWQYWLDASTLPAASYELQVDAIGDGEVKASESVRFDNATVANDFRTAESYVSKLARVDSTVAELGAASGTPYARFADPRGNYLPDIASTNTGESSVAEILIGSKADLEPLLTRYASAAETNNPVLKKLVQDALETFTADLLEREQKTTEQSVYTLESDLRVALTSTLATIDAVSQFKRERTAAESAADTDSDGIADYDEYLVYDTDPTNVDTDEDGVIDGIEVGRGYDPTDPSPEAVVRFASREDVLFKDSSSLTVLRVSPLLLYEKDQTTPLVFSEISGQSLPNSFVTLYIGEKPLTAVVKTGSDGSFSYTLSEELSDTPHDVYAALTDNTGAIVLLSPVFKFAKNGTTYTYPKSNAPLSVQAAALASADEVTLPFNLAAAMGVVGFGLVLLLLAVSLREARQKPAE